MKKEMYLVTGIAGNLGSSVAENLLNKGKNVRGLVLAGDPAAKRVSPEVDVYTGDVTDVNSMKPMFEHIQEDTDVYVIHCAAIVSVSDKPNRKVWEVNVNGTRNVLELCKQYQVKKLVYVSSTGAIPEQPAGKKIREVYHFDQNRVIGYYGKSKAAASQLVMDAVARDGLDASLIFPAGICGPDDYAYGPVSSFVKEYINEGMPAGVAGSFNAVDVRDLADGTVSACKHGRKGEGYILGNDMVSMAEMLSILSNLTGRPKVKTILPAMVAKIIGRISDGVEKVTGKPQKMTSFAVYNLLRNNDFDSSKAKEELGFTCRPFTETMADTVLWLEREGDITLPREKVEQLLAMA